MSSPFNSLPVPPSRVGYTSAPPDTPRRPTGAIATPRHKLAGAFPYRIVGATPAAWIWLPKQLSMWLNDQYGDCVSAEEAFAKACSGVYISDDVVGRWASRHGVLNGAMLDEVLDWMSQGGFPQDGNTYNDGGKLAVDYTNRPLLTNAIAKGPVKIGVAADQLQRTVGGHNGWFGVGYRRDTNTDHCVSLAGYGTASQIAAWLGVTVPSGVDPNTFGYALFTWNTVGFIDEPSMVAITTEAWVRNPTTVIQGSNPPTPDTVFTPTPTPVPPGPPVPPPSPTPPGPPVVAYYTVNVKGMVPSWFGSKEVVFEGTAMPTFDPIPLPNVPTVPWQALLDLLQKVVPVVVADLQAGKQWFEIVADVVKVVFQAHAEDHRLGAIPWDQVFKIALWFVTNILPLIIKK